MDIKSSPDKMGDTGISVITAPEETDTGFIWKIEYSGGFAGQGHSDHVQGRDGDFP
jgi:hypothetical protein